MPSYTQFPRSNVPGKIPTSLDPGSFATNWADGKIYVGGPTGVPQLVGFPLRDFSQSAAYRQGDAVVFQNRIWQCRVSFLSPGPFSADSWIDLTEGTIADAKELASSVLLSGGRLSEDAGEVVVAAGSGIQMNVAEPENPEPIIFSWPERRAAGPFTPNATLVISISGAGALQITSADGYPGAVQRETVRVGFITTDDLGEVVTIYDAPRAAYQTTDTLTDLARALGPFKRAGLSLTIIGVSELEVAPGEAFWATANWQNDTSVPNIFSVAAPLALPVRMASRSGYVDPDLKATIDTTQWDNAGVLQAVPAGQYTNQFVWIDPNSDGVVTLGQAVYGSRTEALDALPSDWEALVPSVTSAGLLVLGCLTSNDDGSDQVVTSSNIRVGLAFGGGNGDGGGGDLSQYLLINGTRPMTGDLNLGGNGIINGEIDGEAVAIKPLALTDTGDAPFLPDGRLTVNTTDEKIYIGSDLISQRVTLFDTAIQYAVGDLVIQSDTLYRCISEPTAPGPFDPLDWQAIGGGGGDLADALIKEPTDQVRNRVDLTGAGGAATAFSVDFDANQGVNVADFGPRASVNRFGVPVGSFGGAVFVASQATHGFTRVGTPVYFNGLNWLAADSAAQARFPNAVVAEVIDANTFTVQVAGRITNLNPAVFEGGVITTGTYYYASPTSGILTATPGATPVPVLYTVSATTGIVKLTGTVIPTVITMAEVINTIYPVGSLYMGIDPTNPAAKFPGTTWVAHAAGRALVGVGNNGESAWTVDQERGSETHTLTAAEIPAHTHTVSPPSTTTSENGAHTHDVRHEAGSATAGSNLAGSSLANNATSTAAALSAGAHTHTLDIPEFDSGSVGGDGAHNNVQPSIGVFVWRRTA